MRDVMEARVDHGPHLLEGLKFNVTDSQQEIQRLDIGMVDAAELLRDARLVEKTKRKLPNRVSLDHMYPILVDMKWTWSKPTGRSFKTPNLASKAVQ